MDNPVLMHAGRRDMARELGVKFEALRLSANDEARRNEGAVGALKHAEECCEAQMPHWKDLAAKGDITTEQAQGFRDRIEDCMGVLRNLRLAAEHNLLAQRGKLAQAETVLDACQKAFDYEGDAMQQVLKSMEEASQDAAEDKAPVKAPRATGQKPAPSIASQRKSKTPCP